MGKQEHDKIRISGVQEYMSIIISSHRI